MVRFAHLADVHLGAFREAELRRLNLLAFTKALDECLERKVDFVVIAGDLFHINIPDLGVVEEAVRKMREVRDAGVPVYVVYGSHDYSPTETSIVDVLAGAGLIVKVVDGAYEEGRLKLKFVVDGKTGVKLCGLSARKRGLEKAFYEELDVDGLEKESGQKVFVFHGAVEEFKAKDLAEMDGLPLSVFPKGFAYYAGGHVHGRFEKEVNGGLMVMPGALFAADFRDLESLSEGPGGFYVVELGDGKAKAEFVPLPVAKVESLEFDADKKSSAEAFEDLKALAETAEGADVVLLKVSGELSSGKPSEIDFGQLRAKLLEKAKAVYVNRNSLCAAGRTELRVEAQSREDIERKIFAERAREKSVDATGALLLLKELRQEQKAGSRKDYEALVEQRGRKVLAI